MPDCGVKSKPKKGKSSGYASKWLEDDAWDAAKASARNNAVTAAAYWALNEAPVCPAACKYRRLDFTIDPMPDPVCKRSKGKDRRHYWECDVECTWTAIVYCSGRHYPVPKNDEGGPADSGIDEKKHRRLNCEDVASDRDDGLGEALDEKKAKAAEKAERQALENAYTEAAKKVASLRCFLDECPTQRIRISVEPPTAAACKKVEEGEHKGEWSCSSSCEYTVLVDCVP